MELTNFICPVCERPLTRDEKSYQCPNGHQYDRAKGGYVNLLMSQHKKEKRHGDDKAMVLARTAFLEAGYYQPLLMALLEASKKHFPERGTFLDLGCGEGFYSDQIYRALLTEGRQVELLGVDISKEAVRAYARRNRQAQLTVASAFALPIANRSCDLVLSVFAPFQEAELCRILTPNGVFLRAYPLEKHLLGLKRLIYTQPYENKPVSLNLSGLTLLESCEIRNEITLSSQEDIQNLFMMTPYFYKTGRADQEKLLGAQRLTTEIEFGVSVYRVR